MKKSLLFTIMMAVIAVIASSCSNSKLEATCEAANKLCPQEIAQGMELNSIVVENGNVVYTVNVNENIYGKEFIDLLSAQKDQTKQALINELKDNEMVKLCKDENVGVVYHYVGVPSEKTLDIEIPASEL